MNSSAVPQVKCGWVTGTKDRLQRALSNTIRPRAMPIACDGGLIALPYKVCWLIPGFLGSVVNNDIFTTWAPWLLWNITIDKFNMFLWFITKVNEHFSLPDLTYFSCKFLFYSLADIHVFFNWLRHLFIIVSDLYWPKVIRFYEWDVPLECRGDVSPKCHHWAAS